MTKLIDLTGQKFGRLTVTARDVGPSNRRTYWRCQCECGQVKTVEVSHLKSGDVKSCGCLKSEHALANIANGMSRAGVRNKVRQQQRLEANTVIGAWTLINEFEKDAQLWWKVRCVCGTEKSMRQSLLTYKNGSRSCGCQVPKHTTHGLSSSPEYRSYDHARGRCQNPNNDNYADYGDRGIEFRFGSFEEFYAELGPRPQGTSVDRIDVNGHYEPGNVRWATPKQQQNNRRVSCR
jgi:hypothetical protein